MDVIEDIIKDCCNQISITIRYRNTFELCKYTTKINSSGDKIKDFDMFVSNLFISKLKDCNEVRCIGSEEEEHLIHTDYINAPYMVCIDPVDGSGNLGINTTTGTIFAIYKYRNGSVIVDGNDIVMAGYCIYGGCTQMVIAKETVSIYQLINYNFVKIKDDIKIPNKGNYYCVNESNRYNFLNIKNINFIDYCAEEGYSGRWVGCMVADAHRILMMGGIFMYPCTEKNKHGKLRLLYEAYPFAFIFKVAGGYSYNEDMNMSILDTPIPINPHQKVPVILCGKSEYESYLRIAI